ncbi:rRNA maturation RNase YbeY [Candidatus Endobugula sertula]|uniref:Endoribonuclease YbeY n=1 Tax=Candidatus Endobugula sertula TaxID=62101 RepID=A0A1D2QLT7_9GAMM|nr:rRNA maturation RNase YbeY [Candidatus Endobugula sertula]
MNYHIDLQLASVSSCVPKKSLLVRWASSALEHTNDRAEMSIRIVDEAESQALNLQYRGNNNPTNVLSFPAELPDIVDSDLIGDVVICAPIVFHEAIKQQKNIDAHWAHMVIHGVLHLSGYDHTDGEEAEVMETLETQILNTLGFPCPYIDVTS